MFLSYHKFELDKRRLVFLTFEDILYVVGVLMEQLCDSSSVYGLDFDLVIADELRQSTGSIYGFHI